MAKNVNDTVTDYQMPTKEEVVRFVKKVRTEQASMDEARGTMGSLYEKAEVKQNIHRRAIKDVIRMDKMDGTKFTEYYFHLIHYMNCLDLPAKAKDLLADRRASGEAHEDAEAGVESLAKHRRNRANGKGRNKMTPAAEQADEGLTQATAAFEQERATQ